MREENNDQRKIFNRPLEQFADAGSGHTRPDLCDYRFFYLALDDKGWLDWAGGDWGVVLNHYRTTYGHAVRVASPKLG